MNLKACCGLWTSKEDEDHDYYEESEEPLPKPKSEAERPGHFQSQQGSMMGRSMDPSALSIKMSASTSSVAHTSKTDSASSSSARNLPLSASSTTTASTTERAIEKSAWDAGAASAASTPAQPHNQGSASSSFWEGSTGLSSRTIGADASEIGNAENSSATAGIDVASGSGRNKQHKRAGSSGNVPVERGAPFPADGRLAAGGEEPAGMPRMTGGSGSGRDLAGSGVGLKANQTALREHTRGGGSGGGWGGRATEEQPKFDLAAFVAKLYRGVLLTKINRQGKAKVRTLFYDEQNKFLWWNEPGAAGRGTTPRPRPSSLLSRRKEQPLPVATLLEVRMASQLDVPFCFEEDVDKSFQLVFPQRTVDLVTRDAEEAALLARGFQELKASLV